MPYWFTPEDISAFSVTLHEKEVFVPDKGDFGGMETRWNLHLEVTVGGDPSGGMTVTAFQGSKIPDVLADSLNSLLPLWNDTRAYRWPPIRSILSNMANPQLASELCFFSAVVFAQKWTLGMGDCASDPNPESFEYPSRDRDADRRREWTTVFYQIQDDVRVRLKLGPPHWSSSSGVSKEVWEEEVKHYYESNQYREDQVAIQAELDRMGIDPQAPPSDFRGDLPERTFFSYNELVAEFGDDAWIHFGRVWEDKWGEKALRADLDGTH